MSDAIELIRQERERQKTVEGHSEAHDDDHADGSLAMAAACYAAPREIFTARMVWRALTFEEAPRRWGEEVTGRPHEERADPSSVKPAWPWEAKYDKRYKHDRKRRLVIAAALIVAELERIERTEATN